MKRTLSVITMCLAAVALAATLSFAQGGAAATPATPATPPAAATKAPAKAKPATMKSEKKTAAKTMDMVDINSATKEELMKVPGIGDATADKIIAGRPFASKAQLLSKGLVTKAQYAKIKGMVTAKQAAAAK